VKALALLAVLAIGCDAFPIRADAPDASQGCPTDAGGMTYHSPTGVVCLPPARTDCPFGWGPYPDEQNPTGWTCQCEQGCGSCPDGWHKAGEWLATCELDSDQ
jgi:hypothetical protein